MSKDLKNELRHYGFTKAQSNRPDWLEVANRLNIFPPSFTTINSRTSKSSLLWKNFATDVKHRLRQKYKYDTTTVRVPVELPYTMRFRNGHTTQAIKRATAEYRRDDRDRILDIISQGLMRELEEDYDGSDESNNRVITGFERLRIVGDEIVVQEGGAIRQRIGEAKIYMREAGMLNLGIDGVSINREWCLEKGTCVLDYLYYQYNDRPRLKKIIPNDREIAYISLCQIFTSFGNTDPITNGITTEELLKFCEMTDIGLLAINKHKKIITYYKSTNRKHPSLVYIMSNNHFYPIEDEEERAKLFKKAVVSNISSVQVATKKIEKKEKNIVFKIDNTPVKEYAEKIITERRTIPKKIRVNGNEITSMEYNDTTYLMYNEVPEIKEYCELNNIPYVGQSPVSILVDLARESGDLITNVKSVFNPQVEEILSKEGVKWRAHYGATKLLNDDRIEWLEGNRDKWFGIDINKCYTTGLYNPMDEWLVYDVEDNWETFTKEDEEKFKYGGGGNLQSGLYIVHTYDFTILHGSNIYSNKILSYALSYNIKFQITHKLVHKKVSSDEKVYPKTYFHPLLDLIKEKTHEKGMMKILNNIISGYLGKTDSTDYIAELDCDEEEVIRTMWDTELNGGEDILDSVGRLFENPYENIKYRDDIILQYLQIEDKKLLLYGCEKRTKQHEQALPLYIQLLDWSNIMLHQLRELVEGEIIYRHTDCIVVVGGKIPHHRLTKKWGDYSLEDRDKEYNWKSLMRTEERMISFDISTNGWKDYEYNSSNQYREIIELVDNLGGLLITGRAGTGKSFVILENIKRGKLLEEETITMSFTNKASLNIKGTTIHKLLHLDSKFKIPAKTVEKLKNIKYFVIDEIGMINNKLWNVLFYLKKKIPKSKFILMGDYRQLPPVDEYREAKWDIFNHPIVKYLCNNNRIELTERQRYDEALWNALEDGYERNDWSKFARGEETIQTIMDNKAICYFNATRKAINRECMEQNKQAMFIPVRTEEKLNKFIEKKKELGFTDEQIDNMIKDDNRQDIYLYSGLPLMSYINNNKIGIVNGEEFMVLNYDEEKIYIQRVEDRGSVGKEIEIDIDDLHKYFLVSYCITAHKSQGATYHKKVIIYDWKRIKQDKELAYTACSRAKLLENIIVSFY